MQVTVRAGPALIAVAVTSGAVHYAIGEPLEATARFGEAVRVTDGNPVLALDLGGVRREATFLRGNDTAELVFTYTVQEGDPEAGIGFPADPVSTPGGSAIRTAEGNMAPGLRLAATAPVVRMDGVRPELKEMEPPEVLGLALRLIYHEALNEDSVPAAGDYTVTAKNRTGPANPTPLPVSAVGVKGNTVTLTLARAPGVSQVVTLGYGVPPSNAVRDLAGNKAVGLGESQKVKSVPTVSVGAVHPKAAPTLGDPEFRVTVTQAPASELPVTLSFEQADEYLPETTATITIPAGRTSAARTFVIADDYSLASGGLTATVTGVGNGYAPAMAPANAATVRVSMANPLIVAQWAENAYTVTEGGVVEATVRLRTAAGVPKPRKDYRFEATAHAGRLPRGATSTTRMRPPPRTVLAGRLEGRWSGIRRVRFELTVATVNDSVVEDRRRRFYLAVTTADGQPRARRGVPRRAPQRARGDDLRDRGHHRGSTTSG